MTQSYLHGDENPPPHSAHDLQRLHFGEIRANVLLFGALDAANHSGLRVNAILHDHLMTSTRLHFESIVERFNGHIVYT